MTVGKNSNIGWREMSRLEHKGWIPAFAGMTELGVIPEAQNLPNVFPETRNLPKCHPGSANSTDNEAVTIFGLLEKSGCFIVVVRAIRNPSSNVIPAKAGIQLHYFEHQS